jgi:4-amino-4-deoxy-L-arabinose transferase-like glycosyltransferase
MVFPVAQKFTAIQRGLQGVYYANTSWKGIPAFSTIDTEINLDTVHNRRLTFPQKLYSIRWTGWIQIDRPGSYIFITESDDGSSLHIDRKLVVDNGGWHAERDASGIIDLEPGLHQIEIEYFQDRGKDAMEAYWQPPDQEQASSMPFRLLFPIKPEPWQLFLEKGIYQGSRTLQVIIPVLLASLVAFNGRGIYQSLKQAWERGSWFFISDSRPSKKPPFPVPLFAFFGLFVFLLFTLCPLYWIQSKNGLVGMYYDNLGWNGNPAFSVPDASLNPRSFYKQIPRSLQEPNSLRWFGWIYISKAAEYNWTIQSDGIVFLSFDGFPILTKEDNHSIQTVSTILYLTKGLYQIELKYLPATGTPHLLNILWGPEGFPGKTLSENILFQEKPNAQGLFFRSLTSWAYRSVQVLLVTFLGVSGLFVLLYQKSLYEHLTQVALFRTLSKQIREKTHNYYLFRQTWFHLLILFGLTLLIVFNNLGRGSIIITDLDEGTYTYIAQTMVKTGEWWSPPSVQGVPIRPPLKYWLSALTFSFLGNTEFFIRIWDAVFGLLTFVLLYFFGIRLFSSKAIGLLSALILLGCRDYISNHGVRAGVLDSLLVFFFVLSLFLFQLREEKPYCCYLAGFCMGLGALTKSFQGLIPLIIIVFYLILTKKQRELKTLPFLGMVVLALLVPALWYVPQVFSDTSLIKTVIVQDLIHRLKGKLHAKHIQGPFFYFQTIYKGFFPWSLVIPFVIGMGFRYLIFQRVRARDTAFRRTQSPVSSRNEIWQNEKEILFLLIWILTLFVGFSLSKLKLSWYMHPLYPALSILIAAVFYFLIKASRNHASYPLLSPFVVGLLVFLVAFSLYNNYRRTIEEPKKLPIHLFTEYLSELENNDYRVVLYNLKTSELTYESRYYMNRVSKQIVWVDNINEIKELHSQGIPFFIILKVDDYSDDPFFRDHLYHYWLAPVYANERYPKKLALVYNYTPDNGWFIKNQKRSSQESGTRSQNSE